jgi:hypothetical protein
MVSQRIGRREATEDHQQRRECDDWYETHGQGD